MLAQAPVVQKNELENSLYNMLSAFANYLDSSPKTVETYTKAIRQLLYYFQEQGITQPTREDIIAFKEALKAKACKPTTIQNYITAVKLFFRFLEQQGIYPNIADHVKGVRLSNEHKKDYLTQHQVKTILGRIDTSTAQGARDFAIFALMVTCGLRTIEVARANIEDLGTVGAHTVLYIQGKGKTEKADFVKISPPVENAIRQYLTTRDDKAPGSPLFASMSNNSNGKALTTRSISGLVKALLVSAGYDSDRLTAHSLRHTAVTLSLLAGKDITEVQQFARHASINTTMIYNHALDKANNTCSDTISSVIF